MADGTTVSVKLSPNFATDLQKLETDAVQAFADARAAFANGKPSFIALIGLAKDLGAVVSDVMTLVNDLQQ